MSRFAVIDTPLADLKIVERQQLGDSRGFLARLFCAEELAAVGWHKSIA
jgi:dTDP-4-dehydrorhamnose 3,5-epimerase